LLGRGRRLLPLSRLVGSIWASLALLLRALLAAILRGRRSCRRSGGALRWRWCRLRRLLLRRSRRLLPLCRLVGSIWASFTLPLVAALLTAFLRRGRWRLLGLRGRRLLGLPPLSLLRRLSAFLLRWGRL
jgi:hypothetical protein